MGFVSQELNDELLELDSYSVKQLLIECFNNIEVSFDLAYAFLNTGFKEINEEVQELEIKTEKIVNMIIEKIILAGKYAENLVPIIRIADKLSLLSEYSVRILQLRKYLTSENQRVLEGELTDKIGICSIKTTQRVTLDLEHLERETNVKILGLKRQKSFEFDFDSNILTIQNSDRLIVSYRMSLSKFEEFMKNMNIITSTLY